MLDEGRSSWQQYGVAVLSVVLATSLTMLLGVSMERMPFAFFYAAVAVSAWYGGIGPGLLTTALSIIATGYFFLPPAYSLSFGLDNFVRLCVFTLVAVLIGSLSAARTRAKRTLRASERQQATIAHLGQRALAGADLSTLMDEAVRLIARTLEVEYCKILELLPEGDALLLRAGVGWQEGLVGHATVSAGKESQAGYTLLASEPVIAPDLKAETRFSGPPLLHEHGVVSGMSVIIHGGERPFGVLGAHTRKRRRFTRDDINFLQAAAHLLAAAIARKRGEEALRASEDRFRIVAETASDAIITIDGSSIIRLANRATGKVFGYDPQELTGQSLTLLMPEYLRHAHTAALQRYVETGVRHISWEAIELPGLHRDGREIPLEVSFAEFMQNGQRFFTGIVRDISERKRAEATMRESEARYRFLTESTPQIIWTARPDGQLDYYNRRWYEYTGLTPEQTEGSGWQPVLHPDDMGRVLSQWATAVETGASYQMEFRLRRAADGSYRWHLGRGLPMRDAQGRIIKWLGTATDIEDQKRSQETLRFLAEASGALNASLDYETTLANLTRLLVPQFADWCAVDIAGEDDALRRLATAHVDPAKVELAWELERRYPPHLNKEQGPAKVIRTGQPELYSEIPDELLAAGAYDAEHLRIIRELGLKSAMIVPLIARGRALGALTFVWAESGRRYEQADLSFAEELARRAALAVDNARLYREAREANRAKDEFLATLSHELRTPLTPIIGWARMMRAGHLPPAEFAQGLRAIDQNSQSLSRLINDLLDMSAILNGKMRIDRKPLALSDILGAAVETARPLADLRRIELQLDTGDVSAPVMVSGDPVRLTQVFWNLLSNAVKFSHDGGRVRVRSENGAQDVLVHIEDEGHGIAPEFLPHIFERFRQADSSTTRTFGGLGIGLALVKSFVEAHGGQVSVNSAGEGRGSRFTVKLPRMQDGAGAQQSVAVAPAALPEGLPGARVLLIEDAPDTAEMLRVGLAAQGFRVTVCESAAEALRVAAFSWFDMIVSDIGLPKMDGYELIGRLRAIPHLAEVPALALTGYASRRDAAAALAAGFDAHLAKPVDVTALAREIERLRRKSDE